MSPAPGPAAHAGRNGAPLVVGSRFVYRLGRFLVKSDLVLLHRFRAEGVEHMPRTGGVLIVANHQSYLDIPIVAAATPRHVAFVARATLARSRFLAFVMRESGAVLIQPNTPDRGALEAMIGHLQQGDCVAVFPEGTRTRDGRMGAFRAGAAVAARRAGAPIVPAAILGAFEAWPRSRKLPHPHRIRLRFGAPIAPGTPDAVEVAKQAIERMMQDAELAKR
ncbi:MAG: 1-acyl-sn-glycerol-3-phosphate acyltransferase [Planctomycetes bacterium]|nr:1-acyl-sn-glycerol-3-phosphate acyltransferase [Planctomycetota bacterium]